MSPRPRTVSDEEILAATARTISRLGPVRLTLADVGRDVGLSPATLLQRFGSKRGLLLALARLGTDSVDLCFAAVREQHASPLRALLEAGTEMTRHMKTPEELANGLAFLQIDLSDPDFHRLALVNSQRTQAGYQTLLDDAVRAGELLPCDTARLARAVESVSGGSVIGWAIHRRGSAEQWVRDDLLTLLAPYRLGSGAPRRKTRSARGGAAPRTGRAKRRKRAGRRS